MRQGWKTMKCFNCSGHGIVGIYSMYDFEGPGECNTCNGTGQLWVSPKGAITQYPGGGFVGKLTKKELEDEL